MEPLYQHQYVKSSVNSLAFQQPTQITPPKDYARPTAFLRPGEQSLDQDVLRLSTVAAVPFKKRKRAPGKKVLGSPREHCEVTSPPPYASDEILRRLEKWELHSLAAEILQAVKIKGKNGKEGTPRITSCMRVPKAPEIEILRNRTHNKIFLKGLVTCGSVWDCNICSEKISIRRKYEIEEAIKIWEGRGGSVHMLTLTFPHYANQKTAPMLAKFSAARRLMTKRPGWRKLEKRLELKGSIYRLEVTYGSNGAHIHSHELLFCKGKDTVIEAGDIYTMWSNACVDSGLAAPSKLHGVNISTPQSMAEYVSKIGKETSKWSLQHEMTMGQHKRARLEGLTPFDLLRAFRDTGDCYYEDLFIEYSQAFRGKSQLRWSPGFRATLGMAPEKTDKEVVDEEIEEDNDLFAKLSLSDWRLVRKYKLRGQMVESCYISLEAFEDFLRKVRRKAEASIKYG